MNSGTPSRGLFDSAKRAVDSLLALAQIRLELLSTELQAEKLRVFDAVCQAILGLVLVGLALVGAMGFVVLLFWDGHRLAAVGVTVAVFAALGVWCLMRARQIMRGSDDGPFALTLGELQRDRDGLSVDAQTTAQSSRPGPQPGPNLPPG